MEEQPPKTIEEMHKALLADIINKNLDHLDFVLRHAPEGLVKAEHVVAAAEECDPIQLAHTGIGASIEGRIFKRIVNAASKGELEKAHGLLSSEGYTPARKCVENELRNLRKKPTSGSHSARLAIDEERTSGTIITP